MKFSEIKEGQWKDLQPYLDTCLLPLTGLTGSESPGKTTEALELLGDLMLLLEGTYKGRIVTYPSLHYFSPPGEYVNSVNHLCRVLKASNFKYVFLVTADPSTAIMNFDEGDLLITTEHQNWTRNEFDHLIREVWQNETGSNVTN